jgi:hypothetical protein
VGSIPVDSIEQYDVNRGRFLTTCNAPGIPTYIQFYTREKNSSSRMRLHTHPVFLVNAGLGLSSIRVTSLDCVFLETKSA